MTLALIALSLGACGGSSDGGGDRKVKSATDPEQVAAAERAVHEKVDSRLSAAREKYSEDAQVYPKGDATCKPFSDRQLDCIQRIRDETTPWTGETQWRATVDAKGGLTVEEHGGEKTLRQHLNARSVAAARAY